MNNKEKTEKPFDVWNSRKKYLDGQKIAKLFFREREIWWCSIGINVGFEQDGKGEKYARPVLVLKKFSKHVFIGVPLSSSSKTTKHYFRLDSGKTLIMSQIRLFDSHRLLDKAGVVKAQEFLEIKKAIRDLLDL